MNKLLFIAGLLLVCMQVQAATETDTGKVKEIKAAYVSSAWELTVKLENCSGGCNSDTDCSSGIKLDFNDDMAYTTIIVTRTQNLYATFDYDDVSCELEKITH